MKATKIVTILAMTGFSLVLIYCTKDKTSLNSNLKIDKLYGSWRWVQSSGGFAGNTITPLSAGYNMTIEFSENGIYKSYKNGQLQNDITFTLTRGPSIFSRDTANLIKYEGDRMVESVSFGSNDTLYLNEECYDCYGHIYVRK